MELVINSPKDKDPSIAASSALFPIKEVRTTDNDVSGPDYKELAGSIRDVFADPNLPTDFKISVLKGVSALLGRQIETSDAFAKMIENLESLNVRDQENREKASKGAIFKPFEKKQSKPIPSDGQLVGNGESDSRTSKVNLDEKLQEEEDEEEILTSSSVDE